MKKKISIVFMGTPEFATASLKAIVNAGYEVKAVVTTPDKPSGRGLKIQESDVKKFASRAGLKILQPIRLKDPDFISELKSLHANLFVVVAFRMLPEIVWSMPEYGTINIHASLLPDYRGAAPINHAIINGETKTGVSSFFIEKEIDTGKIIGQKPISVSPVETAGSLHDKLMILGAELLIETIDKISRGNVQAIDQKNLITKNLKPAPKIFKDDCRLNWNMDAQTLYNKIRGLSPYPAAWTELKNLQTNKIQQVKVFFATIEEDCSHCVPGSIATDGKHTIKVASKDRYLALTEIQQAGKKRMKTEEYLRGQHTFNSDDFVFL